MRSARKEANPVEATMRQDMMIFENTAILNDTALENTALERRALSGKRHEQGCLWSRPSYAFLGSVPRRVPV
jgi:hypothetical protein